MSSSEVTNKNVDVAAQERQQTEQQKEVQDPAQIQQQKETIQPFQYTYHYTSSSHEHDGKHEMKEKYELILPDMEMVAERKPGAEAIFDMKIKKKGGRTSSGKRYKYPTT